MISYFVSRDVVSSGIENAIEYVCGNVPGFVVDSAMMDTYCKTNNITIVSVRDSDIDGLVIPVFANGSEPTVDDDHAQVGRVADVAIGADNVLNLLGREIVFHYPSEGYKFGVYHPINDGRFHIWLNGCRPGLGFIPCETSTRQPVDVGLGLINMLIPTNNPVVILPNGDGIPLYAMISGENAVIAELCKNNLYVLIPMDVMRSITLGYREREFLWKIVFPQIIDNPVDDEDRRAYQEARFASFLEFTNSMISTQIADSKTAVAAAQADIENFRSALRNAYSRMNHHNEMLAAFKSSSEKRNAKLRVEYDLLHCLPFVEQCTFRMSDRVILIQTNVLTCVDERSGVTHELGKFDIEIDLQRANLRFKNLTRQMDEHHAPHVEGGYACLGNMNEMLPELFAAHEYAVIAQMAVRYLQSANPDDTWGRGVSRWPIANIADVPKYVEYFRDTLMRIGEIYTNGETASGDEYDYDGYGVSSWSSTNQNEDHERYPLEIAKRLYMKSIEPEVATDQEPVIVAPVTDTTDAPVCWYNETTYTRRSDAIRALIRRACVVGDYTVTMNADGRWAIRPV